MSQPRRPALVTAVAVVNLIYGGLGLLGLTCAGVGVGLMVLLLRNAEPPPGGGPDPAAGLKEIGELFQSIPGFVPLYVTFYVIDFVMLIGLVVSGFGLLRMKRWARTFCLVYAVYALVGAAALTVHSYAVMQPALQRQAAEAQERQKAKPAPNAPSPAEQIRTSMSSSMGGSVIEIAFAIGLLVVLNLPDVRRAFREAAAGGAAPDVPPQRPPDHGDDPFRPADERFRPLDERFGPGER